MAVFLLAVAAHAQLVAYDDAGNYLTNANWTNGANQGYGYTPWVLLTNNSGPGGFEGWYINPPAPFANASFTNVLGTNYTCVWGIYANGTNGGNMTTAFRGFSNTLGTNTFKIQWGAREAGSTTTPSGTVHGWCGFTLRSGNAATSPSDFQNGVRFYLYFLDGASPSTLYVWDGNGVQSVPNTSFSNLGRDTITNAVEAEITPSSDGMSYHLVLKDVVMNQVLGTLDSVFIGGVGTEDSAALFADETQSPGDQIYNRMQIAIPQIAPEINDVLPTTGSSFQPTNTQLSFELDSFDSMVSSSSVSVYLNGVLQSGTIYNTSSATNQLLGTNNPVLATNTFYTYTIIATDVNGNSATNIVTFDTFSPNNPCIQAEDYNYGGGLYFPNPTPLEYAGLDGTNLIDYLDVTAGENLNGYRPDSSGNPYPQLIAATDTVDHDMYVEDGIQDYQLAYTDAGEWDNYTRSFAGTPFTLWARAASGSGGVFQMNLLANATATTTNQPLAAVGTCNVPNTGGTTVYSGELTPITDFFGNPVVLDLSGTRTLQQQAISSRGYNLYYLMMVPSSATNLLTPYISTGSPARGALGVGLAAPITFTIANRQTIVATNTIQVFLNSTNITSKLKLSNNAAGCAVTYTLTTNAPANYTNTVLVVFNDNTGTNSTTNTWTYVTAASGGLLGNGIWSGGGGFVLNWSTAANWTGGTPGPGYSATFATPGSTTTLVTNNIVDTNFTIASLFYQTNNNGYNTTYVPPGVTLTISNYTTATGTEVLQTGVDTVFNKQVTNTITGAGGVFQILGNPVGSGQVNSLNFQTRQCSFPAAPEQVVLDMSGLGTFIANVGKVTVGQGGSGAYQSNCTARVNLARTNIIYALRNTAGVFVVGDSSGGGFELPACTLNLGLSNAIYFDSMNVGKQKATNALVRFNPVFTNANPYAYIRDTNGALTRVSAWNIGDVSTESTYPVYTSGTVDFSGGTVNALVGTMIVGRGATTTQDTGTAQGTLTMTAGTFNVTNLSIAVQRAVNSATVTGAVNVNGSAVLISTNTGIVLSQTAGGTGPTVGSLNITNGTVMANITTGGGTSIINLSAGTLVVPFGASVGSNTAAISTLNLAGGSVHVNVNGSVPAAMIYATNITASGTTIAIDSLTNISGTNTVHLISYTGADPYAGLTLGAVPYGYAGALVDNTANNSIDLTVSTGALPPPPTIGSITLSGGQIIISGTNNAGVAGNGYSVLTSTNLALPLTSWSVLTQGTFGANGSFSFTNTLGTNSAQFFVLRLP
jgi:hypothetical protein